MGPEEMILPHCSSGSGTGHPVQKLTRCFSETDDMRKEQAKLLLLSEKKKVIEVLNFPQNLLVDQAPTILLSSLKAVSVPG